MDADVKNKEDKPVVDTELTQLNIPDLLRRHSSFMKVIATLFHFGNQPMNAPQIVMCTRGLGLLALRGETPKCTIQGIISSSRRIARENHFDEPFTIDRKGAARQTRYSISDAVLNGVQPPEAKEIPDLPVTIFPVNHLGDIIDPNLGIKRQRKPPALYTPTEVHRSSKPRKRTKTKRAKSNKGAEQKTIEEDVAEENVTKEKTAKENKVEKEIATEAEKVKEPGRKANRKLKASVVISKVVNDSDIEIDSEMRERQYDKEQFSYNSSISDNSIPDIDYIDDIDDIVDDDDDTGFNSLGSDYEEIVALAHSTSAPPPPPPPIVEEDTIANYSLLYTPPTPDMDYIDPINFTDYPIAGHFAIVQQKGYSYPRFRSHEKIKIPKVHCEDKFRVTDISRKNKVVGRLFILADGHGGPGCSEYFVRKTPAAVETVCAKYDPAKLGEASVQARLERDIKTMIQRLDDEYLVIKRKQITDEIDTDKLVDNDGCTLILNLFLGEWLININVGDSRSVLISAPEPSPSKQVVIPYTVGIDNDYKMDVAFASQDHKPYLEHLARHILENGGEFVDSVQNRVIKVEVDKLREDGSRQTKRLALKNARIRPKDYQAGLDQSMATTRTLRNDNAVVIRNRLRCGAVGEDRIPSLNVARSCGDLDFKMDAKHRIISCEPDVTFIRISDQPFKDHAVVSDKESCKNKQRHFLFMSTDGTFDYMYEETADRQNRAIAKVIGPMIEDGEKIGKYLLEEEEKMKGETIEHAPAEDKMDIDTNGDTARKVKSESPMEIDVEAEDDTEKEKEEEKERERRDKESFTEPIPLLYRNLSEEEIIARKVRERTLVYSARYFANREGAHGFFSSTLQDYDDCTIVLVEI